jgi:hypothetical protein
MVFCSSENITEKTIETQAFNYLCLTYALTDNFYHFGALKIVVVSFVNNKNWDNVINYYRVRVVFLLLKVI